MRRSVKGVISDTRAQVLGLGPHKTRRYRIWSSSPKRRSLLQPLTRSRSNGLCIARARTVIMCHCKLIRERPIPFWAAPDSPAPTTSRRLHRTTSDYHWRTRPVSDNKFTQTTLSDLSTQVVVEESIVCLDDSAHRSNVLLGEHVHNLWGA